MYLRDLVSLPVTGDSLRAVEMAVTRMMPPDPVPSPGLRCSIAGTSPIHGDLYPSGRRFLVAVLVCQQKPVIVAVLISDEADVVLLVCL